LGNGVPDALEILQRYAGCAASRISFDIMIRITEE
jgi:hypothetical protein